MAKKPATRRRKAKPAQQASNRRAGNGGVVPPVEHQFKPGQSGNPNGRPKSKPITAAMRTLLDANDGQAIKALATLGLRKALAGDFRYWAEFMNRIDGKVLERMDLTSNGEQFPGLTPEELADVTKRRGGPDE